MSKGKLWLIITALLMVISIGVVAIFKLAWWLVIVFILLVVIAWLIAAIYLIAPRWSG